MPYPGKLINTKALLAKLEATYGTAVAVTATADGQLLALSDRNTSVFTLDYAYGGDVGPSPGNLGMLKRVPAYGRTATGTVPMRAKPAGTTYAATVLPNIHVMAKLSGLDSTLATGAYTYTPTADSLTYSSGTMEAYDRGEKWTLRGALGSVGFDINGAGIPTWLFDIRAIVSATITDSAVAAPTYPALAVQEPVAAGCVLTLGNYTVKGLRSASFRMNRSIDTARLDLTEADAHAGFAPGGYDPEFRVTVESTALTAPTAAGGFDPYVMRNTAEQIAINLTVGSTAFNRWKFAGPQAQLKEFTLNNDGPVATTELVFQLHTSSPIVQTDAFRFVFD